MNPRITEDKKFKEAIGAFIIAFSELEYGLADLGSMTEFDLRKKSEYFIKHVGFPFEKKVSNITEFIEEHLIDLKPTWDELKVEIGQINYERRFIAHGFIQYFLPHESSTTSTYVKKGKELVERQHDSNSIKKLTNRIHHLNTGKNGVNGVFHTLFTKTRVNHWNSLVNEQSKIVYKVNNEIISDWKGK
jgi:hypothetical protein